MSDLQPLLEQTLRRHIRPDASVAAVETRPMREDERGYSGGFVLSLWLVGRPGSLRDGLLDQLLHGG